MKVSDLIRKLKKLPGELTVMLSSDEEGNNYEFLEDVEITSRDVGGVPCHPDDADDEMDKCVVLWP